MKRPWDVQLWLENSPGLTLHSKLLNKLIDDIQKGRLAPGSLLPGSRSLARQHAINRKTVQSVYEELVAQGWLIARQGSGTYVSDVLPEKGLTKSYEKLLSGSDQPETTSKLLEVLSKDARDHRDNVVISNDGTPDPRLIPYELLSRTYRRVCRGLSQKFSLGYGDPKGTQEVRRAVCKMLKDDRFMNCTIDQVCILRGSQMGIYLASKVLDPSKGAIVMEELCYRLAKAAFESNGFTVLLCKLDSQGLNIECLKSILKNHNVVAIYVTPHHQYPTTLCLPMDRRLALLELSRSFGFAILEDDYDHEFHYESSPMPPLASLPNSQNVVYIGSMSE